MDTRQQAQHSLEKAVGFLLSQQRQDGSWPGENFAGPAYTAMCLCVEAHLGLLSEQDAREGAKGCINSQLRDGSYPDYPGAPQGTLDTTALVYAALRLAGVADSDPAQQAARTFIATAGGFAKVCYEYSLYLAMADLYDAKQFTPPSALFKLIPGAQRLLGRRFGLEMAIASNQLPLIVRGLKHGPGINPWLHPLQYLGRRLALQYLRKTQNPAGNWAGILMPTLWGLLCLHYMEVPRDDPAWTNARDYLHHWKVYGADGMQVVPYKSEIWNTALATRALILSGMPVAEPIRRGLDYLLRNQSRLTEPADWQNPAPGAPRQGGWPYEQDNPLCSDCDTTAAVLWTLGVARQHQIEVPEQIVGQGLAWLLGMQNQDGGWAAFAHGLKPKQPGPMFETPVILPNPTPLVMLKMFINPPVEFGDPATEGLTGRVLCALAALGKTVADSPIGRAQGFLRDQRAGNGAWWGRWEVNFLAASSCVLSGLTGVGVAGDDRVVATARRWLESRQNADGGWGECIESYGNPTLAGVGASCGTITGAVLSALLDIGNSEASLIDAGVLYLCGEQNQDGSWTEPHPLYVMIPPNTFYSNRIYSQYSPIEALAKFRKLNGGD